MIPCVYLNSFLERCDAADGAHTLPVKGECKHSRGGKGISHGQRSPGRPDSIRSSSSHLCGIRHCAEPCGTWRPGRATTLSAC